MAVTREDQFRVLKEIRDLLSSSRDTTLLFKRTPTNLAPVLSRLDQLISLVTAGNSTLSSINAKDFATETTLLTRLTEATFVAEDFATETTLATRASNVSVLATNILITASNVLLAAGNGLQSATNVALAAINALLVLTNFFLNDIENEVDNIEEQVERRDQYQYHEQFQCIAAGTLIITISPASGTSLRELVLNVFPNILPIGITVFMSKRDSGNTFNRFFYFRGQTITQGQHFGWPNQLAFGNMLAGDQPWPVIEPESIRISYGAMAIGDVIRTSLDAAAKEGSGVPTVILTGSGTFTSGGQTNQLVTA